MADNWALAEHAKQINEAVSAYIEVQAMNAENEERKSKGLAQAYNEGSYQEVLDKYNLGFDNNYDKTIRFR